MKRAKVEITRELVEQGLATGGDTRKLFTQAGLPDGSKLVDARLTDSFLELLFEHESFPDGEAPTVITPTVQAQISMPPNRFLYHVVGVWSFGKAGGGTIREAVVTEAPIDHPTQLKGIEEQLAARVKANGPNGAVMVGVQANFVITDFKLLRAWHEQPAAAAAEAPQEQPTNGQPEEPRRLAIVH